MPGSLWTCGPAPSPAATARVCHRPPDCTRESPHSSAHPGTLWYKPTSKMWSGMMRPSLETTPKTITLAGNFVFITLGTSLLFVAIQRWFWLSLLGSVESMGCTAAHLRSRSLSIGSLSDMVEGSDRSWDLYTTGQLVDGLQQQQQQKKKKKKEKKPVFIKRKWNHVVFSRATILSFHPVNVFGRLRYDRIQFELTKHKFPN